MISFLNPEKTGAVRTRITYAVVAVPAYAEIEHSIQAGQQGSFPSGAVLRELPSLSYSFRGFTVPPVVSGEPSRDALNGKVAVARLVEACGAVRNAVKIVVVCPGGCPNVAGRIRNP
jgi:hypothetical protein